MSVEPVCFDLMDFYRAGFSGPIELGKTDRDGIRALFDEGDIEVDGAVHAPYSSWSIYAPNCEFFFNSDFRLKAFKLIPFLPKIGSGGGRLHWNGKFEIYLGEQTVKASGRDGIDLLTLPDALNAFRRMDGDWSLSGGDERDIYVEFQNPERSLTFRYEINSVPVASERASAFEIDYFLSSIWVRDQNADFEEKDAG
ncbi:hypothetical protein HFC70_11520 [Agrobacterium sp. a22-2]|uniref:hypothetical protein n=1 Tax=Agrobacterium sp. a22-2 TaxID=2283840 RepID=UPI001447A4A0|nr:hypothetical protein [Agrobacterium sp. a22-2]NKN36984.1 hypothetical protein [Agrobacterium sp. a22-2]